MSLADEIAQDPLGLGYAAHLPGDPQRVVDLLTALNYTMLKPMSAARALVWAAQGAYGAIVDAANNSAHPCRSSCLAFRDSVLAGRDVDLGDPDVQHMFDGWEQVGVITAEQHALALTYATQPASRVEVLGISAPSAHDIIDALKV